MVKSKLVKTNEKIAEGLVGGYKKIAEGVVGGCKKIEEGVAGGFTKMTDKFVDNFLTKEGETVPDAKKRLTKEQAVRKTAAEKRITEAREHMDAVKENVRSKPEILPCVTFICAG